VIAKLVLVALALQDFLTDAAAAQVGMELVAASLLLQEIEAM
jgi:hypothetical protein